MEDIISERDHPTHDEVLSHLANVPGAIGNFVRIYPGKVSADDLAWLNTWFYIRTNQHFTETLSSSDEIQPLAPPPPAQVELLAQPIRLESIQPHYFRGFRDCPLPIRLDGNLVVIDGRNTSGKTSLAEALEWLFTGCLSRRESRELGSPHELENCISNQFLPDDDETWVSGTFISTVADKVEAFTLHRVLKVDYGTTTTSRCISVLFMNDKELSSQEERDVLDKLFASVPPLLMQHTLRLFVESHPRHRREYFERLLHLDELTTLISKAVIGDARLAEFLSPTDSVALNTWDTLGAMVQKDLSNKAYRQASRSEESDLSTRITQALTTIAHQEFSDLVSKSSQFEEIGATFTHEQKKSRQKSFPLLSRLSPQMQISDDLYQSSCATEATIVGNEIRQAWKVYAAAKEAAQLIGSDRLAISHALRILLDANVIQREVAVQICPICAYEQAETLSVDRMAEIESWIPIQEAEASASQTLKATMASMLEIIKKAIQEHDELLPALPSPSEWEEALRGTSEELQQAVQVLRKTRKEDDEKLEIVISHARELLRAGPVLPASYEECEGYIDQCIKLTNRLGNVVPATRRYRDALRIVEAAVGVAASMDPAYRLRDAWLTCFDNIVGIVADLRWEQAKRRAQKDLEAIRDALIEYRQQFLESRRTSFNQGINSVWSALRADRYSSFSKLHIPPPSGIGFPIEIEVKAILDDGQQQKEVDALRVFSESQVNALGIAAFVTRSQLLGHQVLIFDDPVQSMDEEHFKTFAQDVLPHVLEQGFQVILLTHNDMFARDVSHYHYDRPGYVTMSMRLSRREGCIVEEGNRRVPERLKLAERKVEEGNLPEAWKFIRLAIERLYTIVYIKYGPPDFNPDSWREQTAEYMWDSGAGDIIEKKVPDSGNELKDILDMTAAGVHDKPPRGETDLRKSIKYLRGLQNMLGVGG